MKIKNVFQPVSYNSNLHKFCIKKVVGPLKTYLRAMKQTLISNHYLSKKPDLQSTATKRKRKLDDTADPSITKALKLDSSSRVFPAQTPNTKSENKLEELLASLTPIPEVSATTSKIVQGLSSSGSDSSTEQILHSVPAKEKYQELLNSSRVLQLPYHFKKLLEVFESLDATLNKAKYRNIPTFFETLQKALPGLEVTHLQQVLHLFPEAYLIENGLYLDFPKEFQDCTLPLPKSVLEMRKNKLRKLLIEVVKEKHAEFLQEKGLELDPEKLMCWHWEFDLQRVPEVPKALINSDNSSKCVLGEISGNKEPTQKNPRLKARALRLVKLCEVLRATFNSMRMPSVFFHSLVRKVLNSHNFFLQEKDIQEDLKELLELFPNWLLSVKTNSGEVIRMNKEADLSLIHQRNLILKKYNSL